MKKVVLYLLFLASLASAQIPDRKGWWKFDNPANLKQEVAGYGRSLETVGTAITAAAGPEAANGAVRVGIGSYFRMVHNIPANGGGAFVNEYTLAFDFKVPALGVWYTFFQTSTLNANDGECFINPSGNIGVGATGYTGTSIRAGEWYRLVVSVKNGSFYNYYLDGMLVLSGTPQGKDSRFGLDPTLLIFADENGEDGPIDCAELAIWDRPLTAAEVKTLGGYGHRVEMPNLMTRIPYLQAPTPRSIQVCWHDTSDAPSRVEYGLTAALGLTAVAGSELLTTWYRWHSARLTDLQPDTEYHYRVVSGGGGSPIHTFRTLPLPGAEGKIRALLLSDTHSGDSTWVNRVMRAAAGKTAELYGADLQNQLQLVCISGDITVSGGSINHYTDQYFRPMSLLSARVPFMAVPGNHEGENPYYYKYVKYDDVSAAAAPDLLAEKVWRVQAGNTLFIGLNTNIIASAGARQRQLFDDLLKAAEGDPAVDFIFVFFHHLPYSELWVDGVTGSAETRYIRNELFPVIRKYSKVQQLTYGHTHAFERGTIESPVAGGDFRIVCAGGGGGATDNWGEFQNTDHPWIHVAYDHYFFQLLEVDMASQSWEISMYSLGNDSKRRNVQLMDRWYRKLQQPGPDTPVTGAPLIDAEAIILNCSPFSGPDSLMSVRVQVAADAEFAAIKLDTLVHWKNIYGVDARYEPIDTNAGIDLTRIRLSRQRFNGAQPLYYRVRFRDHNLMWSEWSNRILFSSETGVAGDPEQPGAFWLEQNFPNPFNNHTVISYQLPAAAPVTLKLYNNLGETVMTLVDGLASAGRHRVELDGRSLPSGQYYYELRSGRFAASRALHLVK